MQSEYFKPALALEGNSDLLRPQRNSFMTGCKMRSHSSISESGEKAGPGPGAVKANGTARVPIPSQRRTSESSDRYERLLE